jgi:multidrug efflux pump subunit AcrB
MMGIINFAFKHKLLFNLLTVLLCIVGLMKVTTMKREAFPAIDYDWISITTVYPGAGPKEIELYITNPIEREIKIVSGVQKFKSFSIEGVSSILLQLEENLSSREKSKTIDDIKSAVQRVNDLPEDLLNDPVIKEASSEQLPVIQIALTGEIPYSKLHSLADELTDQIETIPDVLQVNKLGYKEKEFKIELDPNKLKEYNIPTSLIANAIKTRNLNLPAGSMETKEGEVYIRTIGEVKKVEDIEKIIVRNNDAGQVVRIEDIGKVNLSYDDSQYAYRADQKSAIILQVVKRSAGDIINLVDKVKIKTKGFIKSHDSYLNYSYFNDISFFVRNRLGILLNNALVGIVLVLISLLFFLSTGIAFVTAIGMPVAFFGALTIMSLFGISINLLTMFALVIVLGMLVDDAIIVAENIWQHYERGESAYDATINGAREVVYPVTATILTSMAAFSPMIMMSGVMGKFMSLMPQVVIAALTMSLIESMLVLPSHAFDAIKIKEFFNKRKNKDNNVSNRVDNQNKRAKYLNDIIEKYGEFLRIILKPVNSGLFLAFMFLLLVGTGLFYKYKMEHVLFPKEGIELFFLKLDRDITSSLENTKESIKPFEKLISSIDKSELNNYVTKIGIQQDEPGDPFTRRGSHLAQIEIFLTAENLRDRTADEIIESIRPKIKEYTQKYGFTKFSFARKRTGPPVGKPVAIQVTSDKFENLNAIGDKINKKLNDNKYVSDISRNFIPGKDELLIEIDHLKAAQTLLSVTQIARKLRQAFSGEIISYVYEGDERVPIKIRYPDGYDKKINAIEDMKIANSMGNLIPLIDVIKIKKSPGVNAVFHEKFKRSMTISANINEMKTSSTKVNESMLPFFEQLKKEFSGSQISLGGEFEDTQKSMKSLFESFIVAFGLIYIILSTQFQSLTKPILVMSAIPFSFIGVVWATYFHNIPLSFLGFIGSIGLMGVIVNDSIVLVDFIHQLKNNETPLVDTVILACKRRFRAVWLTTITTVLGVMPLVYGIGGMDKFLRPAALALGYGLVFGTVLVLIFIPILYVVHERFFTRVKRILGLELTEA